MKKPVLYIITIILLIFILFILQLFNLDNNSVFKEQNNINLKLSQIILFVITSIILLISGLLLVEKLISQRGNFSF
jgi:hypothetical protein